MASAVASRNEPHPYWNNPPTAVLNPRFNPDPTRNPQQVPVQHVSAVSHLRQGNVPSQGAVFPVPVPTAKANERNDSFRREYMTFNVTFNLGSYSRTELKGLRKRFIYDLDRVRALLKRIEDVPRTVVEPMPAPGVELNQPALVEKPEFVVDGKGKSKKVARRKRELGLGLGLGLGLESKGKAKRGRVMEKGDKSFVSMMRKCKQILMKIMKHKHGWIFNTPVDVKLLKLHDYYDIIKRPMDLGTVKLRLDRNGYRAPQDFAADVRLTFNNAMIYNPKGQDVHHMAEMLLRDFEEMFKPVVNESEEDRPKVATIKPRNVCQPEVISPPNVCAVIPPPNMLPVAKDPDHVCSHSTSLNQKQFLVQNLRSPPPVFVTPAVKSSPPRPVITLRSAKLPKPKAKDPNKRGMTCEEKSKLGANLQNLPPEKLEHVVQIVKRRNHNLEQEGDEIELDFEVLDNETLWELDRFITYHKKAMSQMKKQGVIEDAAAEQPNKSPEKAPILEHPMPQNKKGGKVGEEEVDSGDIDIGEEIPVENFPPVQIEKDVPCVSSGSSSSSSSSSGSDSSSSDSGSSSGSDSDEDSVQSPFVEAKEAPCETEGF